MACASQKLFTPPIASIIEKKWEGMLSREGKKKQQKQNPHAHTSFKASDFSSMIVIGGDCSCGHVVACAQQKHIY